MHGDRRCDPHDRLRPHVPMKPSHIVINAILYPPCVPGDDGPHRAVAAEQVVQASRRDSAQPGPSGSTVAPGALPGAVEAGTVAARGRKRGRGRGEQKCAKCRRKLKPCGPGCRDWPGKLQVLCPCRLVVVPGTRAPCHPSPRGAPSRPRERSISRVECRRPQGRRKMSAYGKCEVTLVASACLQQSPAPPQGTLRA